MGYPFFFGKTIDRMSLPGFAVRKDLPLSDFGVTNS